jgi:hypothetical protein
VGRGESEQDSSHGEIRITTLSRVDLYQEDCSHVSCLCFVFKHELVQELASVALVAGLKFSSRVLIDRSRYENSSWRPSVLFCQTAWNP